MRNGAAWNGSDAADLPYWRTKVVAGGSAGGIIGTPSVDETAAERVLLDGAAGCRQSATAERARTRHGHRCDRLEQRRCHRLGRRRQLRSDQRGARRRHRRQRRDAAPAHVRRDRRHAARRPDGRRARHVLRRGVGRRGASTARSSSVPASGHGPADRFESRRLRREHAVGGRRAVRARYAGLRAARRSNRAREPWSRATTERRRSTSRSRSRGRSARR